MQTQSPHTPSENLLFFDFETDQSSGEHIPNLCVVQDFEGKQRVFEGPSTLNEFCRFLFSEEKKNYTAIAHHSKGFDSLFILQWLFKNMPTGDIRIIRSGQKIMQLQLRDYNIRIIDSLNFFHMKLADLPKAFGLDTNLAKGTFPHLFNTQENWEYKGPLPDLRFFDPDRMREKERAEFLEWYHSLKESDYVFDFRKEILQYCVNDVSILRESCLCFRRLFLQQTEVDPFRYITIASSVMAVFRSNFLKPETIAIVPNDNYRGVQKLYSRSSIQWLDFVSYMTNTYIQHAENKGEYCVYDQELDKRYYLDGYSKDSEGNETVYSFYGCVFHSHSKCTASEAPNIFKKNVRNAEVYEQTLRRQQRLEQLGFNVYFIWECDFQILAKTPVFKAFLKTHEIPGPLIPRESFFGGRTNAVKLFYKAKSDERICYYDVCSLYPYVNKNKTYPIGHPKVITQDFAEINQYFGLIKCKVLPPPNLYFPVLPAKIHGKLYFPLCKLCAINREDECFHTIQERAFWGTWTTIELPKAVELGYEVVEIKEVWHFDRTSDDLFKSYVNTFLKIKQESSGFPQWVQTEADRERYINEYSEVEGIRLNAENIAKNPPLRQISKLALNSLWGKFGQITDQAESEFVSEPKRFFELCNSSEHDIEDLFVINDNMVEVVYRKKREFVKENQVTNFFIAVFTTAYARLELFNLLHNLGTRILYFDTDSVFLVSHNNNNDEFMPKLSDYLGGLTDEIEKEHGADHYIKEFVSTGPKSYSYTVTDGSCKVKIKGFSLNYKNTKKLNMKSMKKMIKRMDHKVTITENKIARERVSRAVVNRQEKKTYQLVYDKRIIVDGGADTLPFGYTWNRVSKASDIQRPHPSEIVDKLACANISIYSEHCNPKEPNALGELFPYENQVQEKNDTDQSDIDLMATSESESEDDELNPEDIQFLDNNEMDEDLSFYRAIDNELEH